MIRPGQLNLMTAGAGIAHAEEATGQHLGTLQGIQLWVAQPDAVRFGSAAFEHHGALPQVEVDGGVATVLIGTNDWAAAWAVDNSGRPLYAVVPEGERQRELAYRFGVNVVMYALTGNYKSDQVHVPFILERLGQ